MAKKFRDADKELKKAGFTPSRQKGSHITYKNDDGKTVTVPKHDEIKTGTWNSIQKQAGLKKSRPMRTEDAEHAHRLMNDGMARPGSGPGPATAPQARPAEHGGRRSERSTGIGD
ncbi:type II toxin-antitoxin system HicA family toxin [Kribbella sp. HUAS MG21]|uniref:Type II toxin-antitoxin system HicA family toxin n=1 Tax=Kribbella sp. HUAS MG21 TaxID=3160966 RepID=A0AAU7T4G6_9ACTN